MKRIAGSMRSLALSCVIVVLLLQVCATAVMAQSFSIHTVSTATVTVDEAQTTGYLASDFVGLSYEASKLATSGFDPSQGNMEATPFQSRPGVLHWSPCSKISKHASFYVIADQTLRP